MKVKHGKKGHKRSEKPVAQEEKESGEKPGAVHEGKEELAKHHAKHHNGKHHHGKHHHSKHHHSKHHGGHGESHHKAANSHSKKHHKHKHHKHSHDNEETMPTAQPYENIEIVRESTINLKKVQENDWSLQCDRILVYGRGFESKMQSWVDIHKKVKEVHPKGATLSMDEVQARYDILAGNKDFASRLELLTLSVEDEVLQKGIGVAAEFGVTEPVIRQVGDENASPSKQKRDGNLKIKCLSKKARGRDVPHLLGIKQQLERSSPLLSAVLRHERDKLNDLLPGGLSSDPCLRYNSNNSTLEIHENCYELKGEDTYGFCEKNVFEKFLVFCEDSSILHRFKENKTIAKAFHNREKIVNEGIQRDLRYKMNNVLDELQKTQKKEINTANERLEELKEMEMKRINEKYDRLRSQQEAALKVAHEQQCAHIKAEYAAQRKLAKRISKSRLQRQRKKRSNLKSRKLRTNLKESSTVTQY